MAKSEVGVILAHYPRGNDDSYVLEEQSIHLKATVAVQERMDIKHYIYNV
jgi:hypothetical protein